MPTTEPSSIKCQYCQSPILVDDPTHFRVRCENCGRTVMPRNWGEVVSDPQPSILFEPLQTNRHQSEAMPNVTSFRLLFLKSHTARSKILKLILLSSLSAAVAGGIFTGWYLLSDVLLSGAIGLLLATFILIMPEIMVAIGTGAITLGFCSFFFGLYGNRLINMVGFFGVGFGFALILQVVRRVIQTAPPEPPVSESHVESEQSEIR